MSSPETVGFNIAWQRLINQRLAGNVLTTPGEVVGWFGAVQAQDYAGAKWAVGQRTTGTTSAAIDRLFNAGEILRTHVMRPTWHFVLPTDIRWLLKLTGPRVHAFNAYYYRKYEVDEALNQRVAEIFTKVLQGENFLTRDELAGELEKNGIEASGIRLANIIMRTELDGLICSGPLRGKQFTYALLDERIPQAETLDPEAALAELTRRYFTAHGPATSQDYAWWSGLTQAEVKNGLAMNKEKLAFETLNGKTYWFPLSPTPAPVISHEPVLNLLPNFDEHVVAYKDHTSSYDPANLNGWEPTNATLLANSVVVNGLVTGGWRRTVEKDRVVVTPDLAVPLQLPDEARKAALEAATAAFGRFLEMPAVLG